MCPVLNSSLTRAYFSTRCFYLTSSPPPPLNPALIACQLFYSFFKTLVGKEIAVELKNDVALTGTLHSVDQYLNVKLTDVHVVEAERYPQLVRVCDMYMRSTS